MNDNKIRDLISTGKVKEVFELLENKYSDNKYTLNELALLKRRLNENERRERLGISSPQERNIELNKISISLLEVDSHSINENKQNLINKGLNRNIVGISFLLILSIFVFIYFKPLYFDSNPNLEDALLNENDTIPLEESNKLGGIIYEGKDAYKEFDNYLVESGCLCRNAEIHSGITENEIFWNNGFGSYDFFWIGKITKGYFVQLIAAKFDDETRYIDIYTTPDLDRSLGLHETIVQKFNREKLKGIIVFDRKDYFEFEIVKKGRQINLYNPEGALSGKLFCKSGEEANKYFTEESF